MADVESAGNHLTREQKIGFVLLLFFAILAVGLGILQIRNTMYAPFALTNDVPPDLKDKVNDVNALHYRDTDMDGLSDFDELYVYGTSPYLTDTDSDGIDDKKETEMGRNPLCAEGKECANEDTFASQTTTSSTPEVTAATDPGSAPQDVQQMLKDPKQLRQLLLQAGMEKKVLDTYSDKDLLKMVQDLMGSNPNLINSATTTQ